MVKQLHPRVGMSNVGWVGGGMVKQLHPRVRMSNVGCVWGGMVKQLHPRVRMSNDKQVKDIVWANYSQNNTDNPQC